MNDRRSYLILLGLILAALVGVALLAIPGSPVHKKPRLGLDLQGGLEVVLKAVPPKGKQLTSSDVDRSIGIMRNRIDKLGVSEPEIRKQGSNQIVIELAGVRTRRRPRRSSARRRSSSSTTSRTTSCRRRSTPRASRSRRPSLYALLSRVQSTTGKNPEGWYVFNRLHKQVVGPVDTKAQALKRYGGKLPKGYSLFAVPTKTTVITCGPPAVACPGVNTTPASTSYYLFKYNPPFVPEMTGSDLKLSGTQADFDPTTGQPIVLMQFTGKGGKLFHKITRIEAQRGRLRSSLIGQDVPQHFAIVLDGQIQSYPQIDFRQYPDGIAGTSAQITGIGSIGEAKSIALVLQTGALPVNFVQIERTDVSATLGKDSLNQAMKAALIGLLLVAIFLLVLYRFLGLVAVIGLAIYVAFLYAAILLLHVTLTLPGFAGMILTIGVAADANVVVFERIKEEVRAGKSVRAGVATGYAKGFHTILDANVVTCITALVLFAVATAGVKGFALMLLIGTVISLLTAVFATRAMLGLLAGFKWFDSPRLMGAHGAQTGKWLQIDFMKRRRTWFAISGTVIAISIVALGVRGLNLGIDFKGGTQVTFKTAQPTQIAKVRGVTAKLGYPDAVIQGRGGSKRRRLHGLPDPHQGAERAAADPAPGQPRDGRGGDRAGRDHGLVQLRQPDRAPRDHRDHRLAAPDHLLHHDSVRPQVRGAGDPRPAPRHHHHGRDLRAHGLRGLDRDRGGGADRPRLLDLRHDHHLRPDPRERGRDAPLVVRRDREHLALGDDQALARDDLHHAAADRLAAPLRRRDPEGLRLCAPDRDHLRGLLLDLHRGAAADDVEGARARLRSAQEPGDAGDRRGA